MRQDDFEFPPTSIGTLNAGGGGFLAYIFIPPERMPDLAAVAQSGRLQTIRFIAARLRYRQADIRNLALSTRLADDD
jgi:hypothetical protein